jgi:hypothetical protein
LTPSFVIALPFISGAPLSPIFFILSIIAS